MSSRLVLGAARLLDRPQLADVVIEQGVVSGIVPAGEASDVTMDLGGRLVIPSFVEPHLHLDKAMLGSSGVSDLSGAIAETARRKAGFTHTDMLSRAERVLAMALRAGTTAIRAQTEVDPAIGLRGVAAMTELADRHRDWLRLQISVFPQEGIFCRPGTEQLLRAATRESDVVVGGCPYVERDPEDARRHVDFVLDLAEERGALADFHLDFADDASDGRFALARYVATATKERGLQGRVALGHATSLAALSGEELARGAADLSEADIAVVVLPATDLHLMGRSEQWNPRRGVAPYRVLREAGVRVALSSNNVRNAFTPTGTADPLDIALLLGRLSYATTEDDFTGLLAMATAAGQRILDPAAPEPLSIGSGADLVVLDSCETISPVVAQPTRRAVVSRGVVVYSAVTQEQYPPGMQEAILHAPTG